MQWKIQVRRAGLHSLVVFLSLIAAGKLALQPGTPRHLPVPAKELETLGIPVYTYGGSSPNPVFPEK